MAFAEVCEVRTAAKCYTPPNIVGGPRLADFVLTV